MSSGAGSLVTEADADAGPDSSTEAPRRRGRHPVATFLRELVVVLVGALVVSAVLRAFVGQMFVIPSGSMENTLLERDRVVVQKITDFRRGDVVVFSDPANWLPDEPTGTRTVRDRFFDLVGIPTASSPGHLIKRVIGTARDVVVCCDAQGRITVNGTALDETAYLYTGPSDEQVEPSEVKFRVVVPHDHVFVLGDHRNDSADSRAHFCDASTKGTGQSAFVPVSDVVGPAFAVVAPLDRARRLRVPATFAAVAAPAAPAPASGTIEALSSPCP